MEAEVRSILEEAVRDPDPESGREWHRRIRERLERTGTWWDDEFIASLPDRKSNWAVSPEDVERDRAARERGES